MPSSGTAAPFAASQAVAPHLTTASGEVRRAMEDAMTTTDLEVARKGARLLHMQLIETERELLACKERACVAESIMLSLEASKRDRRKSGGKRPEDDWPQFPPQIVKEGQAIRKSAHKAARVYFTFFSSYAPSHIWTVREPGWSWNDAGVRFDVKFPDNRKIGQALELVQALDQRGLEWLKRGTAAYREQFESSLAIARYESIKRVRDHGAEIFEDLKDRVNAGFLQLQRENAEPLTYRLLKQDPVILSGFGNSLFLHESSGARRLLPGVADLVGIWEDDAGNFESSPLDAEFIYTNYKVVPGEEFQSELLFRTARSLLYGVKSMRKKSGLVFDKRSQLKGVPLSVTPGLIVGTVTLARIAFSPEDIFAGDGKGPLTKIQFDKDADEMLEMLMSIWDEPGGKKIRDAWTMNIFPSLAATQRTSTTSTTSTPEPAPKRRINTAAQIIARNREAVGAGAFVPPLVAFDQEDESYHIPEDSFYVDHTLRHTDASIHYDYDDLVTSFIQADNDDNIDDEDKSDTSFYFDEDAGDVLAVSRQASATVITNDPPLVVEPEQHASTNPDHSLLTSSPPRQVRLRAPPMLVPAVARRTSGPGSSTNQAVPFTVSSGDSRTEPTRSARLVTPSHDGVQPAQLVPRRPTGPPSRQSGSLQAPSSKPPTRAVTPASTITISSTVETPPASITTEDTPSSRASGGIVHEPQMERGSRHRKAQAEVISVPSESVNSTTRVASAQEYGFTPAPLPVTRRTTRRTATASGSTVSPMVDTLASGVAQLSVIAAADEIQGAPARRAAKKPASRGRAGGGAGSKAKKR